MVEVFDGARLLGANALEVGIPDVRFQPDLSEALRALPRGLPARLLVVGPSGCGQSSAARWVAFLRAGAGAPVVRVLPGELRSESGSAALDRLRASWDAACGGVLMLPPLDDLIAVEYMSLLVEALDRWAYGAEEPPSLVAVGDAESSAALAGLSPRFFRSFVRAEVSALSPRSLAQLSAAAASPPLRAGSAGVSRLEGLFSRAMQPGDLVNSRLVRHVASMVPEEGGEEARLEALCSAVSEFVASETSSALEDLQGLIGLSEVKDSVERLAVNAALSQRRRILGLDVSGMGHHMVFAGPAGTAKTTVARIVARVLRDIGVLRSGHMVEVQRADLIGFSSAETSRRMVERVRRSFGGVLFIDEAYTLTSASARGAGEDQGREAVDTLLKMMEDYRDEFVVIVAGYPAEMDSFLNENPGLRSRFSHKISFPPYSPEEMMEILSAMAAARGYSVGEDVAGILVPHLNVAQHYPGFGNGRYVRTALESAIVRQGERLDLSASDADLRLLRAQDFSSLASGGHRFGIS